MKELFNDQNNNINWKFLGLVLFADVLILAFELADPNISISEFKDNVGRSLMYQVPTLILWSVMLGKFPQINLQNSWIIGSITAIPVILINSYFRFTDGNNEWFKIILIIARNTIYFSAITYLANVVFANMTNRVMALGISWTICHYLINTAFTIHEFTGIAYINLVFSVQMIFQFIIIKFLVPYFGIQAVRYGEGSVGQRLEQVRESIREKLTNGVRKPQLWQDIKSEFNDLSDMQIVKEFQKTAYPKEWQSAKSKANLVSFLSFFILLAVYFQFKPLEREVISAGYGGYILMPVILFLSAASLFAFLGLTISNLPTKNPKSFRIITIVGFIFAVITLIIGILNFSVTHIVSAVIYFILAYTSHHTCDQLYPNYRLFGIGKKVGDNYAL